MGIKRGDDEEWKTGRQSRGGGFSQLGLGSSSKAVCTGEVEIISRWPQESGEKAFTSLSLASSAPTCDEDLSTWLS